MFEMPLSLQFNFLLGVANSIQIHTHELKWSKFFSSEFCIMLLDFPKVFEHLQILINQLA